MIYDIRPKEKTRKRSCGRQGSLGFTAIFASLDLISCVRRMTLVSQSHGGHGRQKLIAYYRVSTDHQGMNGNGASLSGRRSRTI